MNKRIKKKKEKNNNTKRMNSILNKIEEKYKISEKKFGNGYFIFDMGENAVCHFKFRELKDWKFGIWLDEEGERYDIFGEHIELIDKFKPSRCYISYEEINLGESLEDFLADIEDIIKNPIMNFSCSLTYSDEMTEEEALKVYKEFYKEKEMEEKRSKETKERIFDYLKNIKEKEDKVTDVFVRDQNGDGWKSTPRYEVTVVIEKETSDEEAERIFKEISEVSLQKEYSCSEHSFDIYEMYDGLEGLDLKKYRWRI